MNRIIRIYFKILIDKIILGTAQFGLDYGVNNNIGKIQKKEVFKILDFCVNNGIRGIDTAGVYGNSESLIGEFISYNKGVKFEITTKIKKDSDSLIEEIDKSLDNLNVDSINELLFHSLEDFNFYKIQLQNHIQDEKTSFERCGISLYSNNEIKDIIDIDYLNSIQFPFNIFDNINHRGDIIRELKNKKFNVTVRSIFLQGLLLMDLRNLPKKLKPLEQHLQKVKTIVNKYKLDIKNLAINYCLNQNIDGIVIGFDSLDQLKGSIKSYTNIDNAEIFNEINNINIKTELIDPRYW